MLKTRTKIALARSVYRLLRALRIAGPPGRRMVVRRSGIRWSLDPGEGIDFSIYLLGAFERSTVRVLRTLVKPGNTVLDIGANIGAHTLHLAKDVGGNGRVFAFEATDYAFSKLMENLQLNPDLRGRVVPVQTYLTDRVDRERQPSIYSGWPLESRADLHPEHLGELHTTTDASVRTLDSAAAELGIGRVDVIKIDVDGHEYPILRGGQKLLQDSAPVLVMELSPYIHSEEGNSFEALIQLLRDHGYELREVATGKALTLDADSLRQRVPEGAGINVIATARSRA